MAALFVLKRFILTGSQSGSTGARQIILQSHSRPAWLLQSSTEPSKDSFQEVIQFSSFTQKVVVLWNESFTNHTRLVRTGQSGAAATFPVGLLGLTNTRVTTLAWNWSGMIKVRGESSSWRRLRLESSQRCRAAKPVAERSKHSGE